MVDGQQSRCETAVSTHGVRVAHVDRTAHYDPFPRHGWASGNPTRSSIQPRRRRIAERFVHDLEEHAVVGAVSGDDSVPKPFPVRIQHAVARVTLIPLRKNYRET